jgi:hypothetical protein
MDADKHHGVPAVKYVHVIFLGETLMNTFGFWKVLPFLSLVFLLGCTDSGMENDAADGAADSSEIVTGTGNGNGAVNTETQSDANPGSPGNNSDGSVSTNQP